MSKADSASVRRIGRYFVWCGVALIPFLTAPGIFLLGLLGVTFGGYQTMMVFYGWVLPILLILVGVAIRRRVA
jgi:hypothetical protein